MNVVAKEDIQKKEDRRENKVLHNNERGSKFLI
jgi:hypothetical protein